MLPDLLKVCQTRSDTLQNSTHATKCSYLQALAPVQGISILEQPQIVLGDLCNDISSCIDLTQSKFVVILVVEHMKQIAIERMDVIQSRKLIYDGGQLLIEVLLGIPNLAHIELADAVDSIALVDNSRCLPLSAGQDYVDEVLPRRDNSDLLEIILHHLADIKFGYLFVVRRRRRGELRLG